MSSSSRRMASAPKAGSVWETRIKLDDVNGGIKVFHADSPQIPPPATCKQTPVGAILASPNKRKTWKSESSDASPVQIARRRSDSSKNSDEKLKESGAVRIKKTVSTKLTSELGDCKSESGDFKNSPSLQLVKVTGNNSHVEKKVIDEPKLRIEGSEEECEVKEVTSNFAISDQIQTPSEEEDGEIDKEIKVEIRKKNIQTKEIDFEESEPKKFVIDDKKSIHRNERSSPLVKTKQLPFAVKITPNPTKTQPAVSDYFHEIPRTQNRLQSLVDLIMWRDVSKSALVFGIGTFLIISSSFTKDLNISFISVISYVGLVYLAAIFLFRSLVSRNIVMEEDSVIGEEEAIWLVKVLLPYVNEFLLKLRALFSGDPATTMKLAVLLFILARCGSSFTLWKLAKLGFVGIFTVPKLCSSSYSLHFTSYGVFWKQRFMDGWESWSHKKALGFAIFAIVWNLSSVVARIWAVFLVFVAFKYYQHSNSHDTVG